MKKQISVTLVIIMLLLVAITAFATAKITVYINGKSVPSTVNGKNVMVNINDIASALKTTVTSNGNTRDIKVPAGNAQLLRDTTILYNGEKNVFKENEKLTAPLQYDGKIYIPLDFLSKTGLTPINYLNNGKKIVLGVTGEKFDMSSNVRCADATSIYDMAGQQRSLSIYKVDIYTNLFSPFQTRDSDTIFSAWGDEAISWLGIITSKGNWHSEGSARSARNQVFSIVNLDGKYKTLEFDLKIIATNSGNHDLDILGNTTGDTLKTITVNGTAEVTKHITLDVTGQDAIVACKSGLSTDFMYFGSGSKIMIADPVAY